MNMPNPPLQQDLADLRALIARIAHTLDKLSPRERAALGAQEPLVSQLLQIQNANGQADEISALSQVEQALRESEQREKARVAELETLMDVVPAMIWISRDPQCKEMRGNRYGYEFLKMWERANISKTAPGEALQQQPYRNFKDGREIPPEELPMQIAAATGQSFENYTFDLVFDDGTLKSVLGNVQPLFDENGNPCGAISAFVDATQRKSASQRIAAEREWLRVTLASIGDAVITSDAQGRVTFLNPVAEKLTGWSNQQAAGQAMERVFKIIYEQTRLPVEDPVKKVIETGSVVGLGNHTALISKQGEVTPIEDSAAPIRDANGGILGAVVVFHDVTEKRMHEKFRKAINEIDLLLNSTLDVDQVMSQAVSAASQTLGSETAALSLREGTGWVVSYVHGFPEEIVGTRMDDDQERHAILAIQSRKPVAISDAFHDERVNQAHMRKWGVRSVLVVPVLMEDKALGCIFFNYYEAGFEFKPAHIDFASQLAASISLALKNASLVRSLEEEIAYRSQIEQEALTRRVQIELQQRLLEQREQERQSIARDLHDGPLQELIAAEYTLAAISASLADQSLFEDLHEVQDILKSQILALRAFASELRPPALANFGLGKALRSYLDTYQEKHPNLSVRYDEKQEGEMIPQEARLALFRILQESLHNINRHARATAVRVSLVKTLEQAVLEIQDNGVGFEVSEDWLELARNGHLGLVGMRERAEAIGGQIDVCSGKGEGTRIRVSVPMNGAS
jgi:PAS domain S-box-containing protein